MVIKSVGHHFPGEGLQPLLDRTEAGRKLPVDRFCLRIAAYLFLAVDYPALSGVKLLNETDIDCIPVCWSCTCILKDMGRNIR